MQRIILHIDFDSFFASCEQQFNPALRGKPIGVTATNGRTCIIAASREAKKSGVKSPSRVWEAQQIVPDLITVPGQFDKYWEISKKFINVAKDYTPFVEVFSLDEVFMDVTKTAHLYKGVYPLIARIKQRLAQTVGEYITVSVGVSHNKLLAKLASGMRKPNGVMEITPENLDDVYSETELTDICGIGERIARRLHLIGVYSLFDLRNISFHTLHDEFGTVEATFLKNVGFGIDHSSVIPYYEASETKSVGRNYCLPRNEYNERIVLQNIYELCEELGIKLRRLAKKARRLGISLRGNTIYSARKTYTHYFDTGNDIFQGLMKLMNGNPKSYQLSNFHNGDYVRQISVWVAFLDSSEGVPLFLFDEDNRKTKLFNTIDAINDRYGDHTIRNGFLLYADKLTTKPNGFLADKYEREQLRQEGLRL